PVMTIVLVWVIRYNESGSVYSEAARRNVENQPSLTDESRSSARFAREDDNTRFAREDDHTRDDNNRLYRGGRAAARTGSTEIAAWLRPLLEYGTADLLGCLGGTVAWSRWHRVVARQQVRRVHASRQTNAVRRRHKEGGGSTSNGD